MSELEMRELEIENPRIRPLSELLGENFLVPRYQRGYRWGKQEITDLLDDILQYYIDLNSISTEKKVGKFYCLQPIVVKAKQWKSDTGDNISGWELIDGQQRLTSIFIILTYLEDIRQFYDSKKEIYTIDFETRENCKAFFSNKEFVKKIDDTNVDFYHISKGYEYITNWFSDKLTFRLDFLKTILNTENNVSIIWYEAKDEENKTNGEDNSIDLFTRLNDGKIPLTDAELIKALLLQGDRYPSNEERYIKQRLFEIASEWDEIEASLQDEKMWLFLNDTNYQPPSKIEFIFKLLAEKWNQGSKKKLIQYENIDGKPKHFEYLVFDKYLTEKRKDFLKNTDPNKDILDPVNDIWKEIKEKFSVFNEWFEDHTLYHYIGYLIAIDNVNKEQTINELLSEKVSKKDFVKLLKRKIAGAINFKIKKENSPDYKVLSDLSYGSDNSIIIKILLLLNVETLIASNKENARFPFHLYKKEKITSIEHIHPQNPDSIDTDEDMSKIWIESHKRTLKLLSPDTEEQQEQINQIVLDLEKLLLNFNKELFKRNYATIIELYTKLSHIKETEVHTLYNLALVDKDTNSALNNSFFNIKRDILKENKLGRYIPVCTQRVFSKYYLSKPQEMIFWSDEDRKAYFGEIESLYNSFIKILK
jgi:uncharacterized protein with ParB-like and HNH nuclease domain